MTINVTAEIVAIRERIARIEAVLDEIRKTLAKQPAPGGSLVVPLSVVIVIVQAITEAIKHYT